MATEDLVTLRQVMTPEANGEWQFVTHSAAVRPDRFSFASQDELNTYLVQTLGAATERGGVGAVLSRRGKYVRRSPDNSQAITFGEPVLDTISSPAGKLVVGSQTIDLLAGHAAGSTLHGVGGAGSGAVVFDAPALTMTGIVNDAERWIAADGSYVEYRIRNGRLGFHAWKSNYVIYWSMGLEVSVWNTPANYEAARITSMEYMSVTAPCQQYRAGEADDLGNNYLDRMDWGVGIAQQPERVAGVCQARWHHRNFGDLVTAGMDACATKPISRLPHFRRTGPRLTQQSI
jgi:hypothetical protein